MAGNSNQPDGHKPGNSEEPHPIYELPSGTEMSMLELSEMGSDGARPPRYSLSMNDDGRIDVDADSAFVRGLSRIYSIYDKPQTSPPPPAYTEVDPATPAVPQPSWSVKLNIVIQVVGSRGDVQPFIALGNELQRFGHRVRLATHNVFDKFVRDSGLEFYPIGGDPAELMAYMVKNPGLIPKMQSLQAGEIHRKRVMVRHMLDGCWRSCIEPDLLTGQPFVADAIIANPPSFAHIHCAQALAIPVHLVFTMPWTKTTAFPHPLANLKNANDDRPLLNYVSYGAVNWLTWQGLGDVINEWRGKLDLEEVPMTEGADLADTLKIPFTYCWSPALVPKPRDWPSHIDVCGFFFREPPNYEPPSDLAAFLRAGPPPVYIGFGSIVLDDPDKMTTIILGAVEAAGCRAIVSKGWSKLAGAQNDNVFFVGDCPHEWLFQQVAAVVHHGGAGTTACGLRYGKPTVVVPFFGDQPFWGNMIAARGAGPTPIHHKALTVENLAQAIRFCLTPEAATAAAGIAEKMRVEDGVRTAVDSFHRNLPLADLQCDILPDQPAAWSLKAGKSTVKLSKVAAETLLQKSAVAKKHLKLHKSKRIIIENRRWDPVSGGSAAVLGTFTDLTASFAGTFYRPYQEYVKHQDDKAYEASLPSPPGSAAGAGKGMKLDDSASIASSVTSTRPSGRSLGSKMASSSAKSIGGFAPTAAKGMLVDIPLAMTEGLRNLPRCVGDDIRDNGHVTDWKSGATVAGKTFFWGMAEGISDIAVKPWQGAREEGAKGAVKGLGKGMLSMTSKTGAAMFGVFAYPSAGIAKSIRSSVHSGTRKRIAEARHQESKWLIESRTAEQVDSAAISSAFEALKDPKK